MRKIETKMIEAIKSRKTWGMHNTMVKYLPDLDEQLHGRIEHAKIYLWGNHIATYSYSGDSYVVNMDTYAKWPTRTTKSRINALRLAFKSV